MHTTIIGAGIVGLATGLKLLEKEPGTPLVVLDKEAEVAAHQTGHNSGVIHSGIYYKPGSAKAVNCRDGYLQLLEYCDANGVDYDICGKVIVATSEAERPMLKSIYERGLQNGMKGLKMLSAEELAEKEPHTGGVEAIWVPQTGIIDYKDVAESYAARIRALGGEIQLGCKVIGVLPKGGKQVVEHSRGTVETDLVINCAGLYSDKVARMTMPGIDLKVLPFRGEYYKIKPEKQYLVNNLIYPVPNPNFPFLGVHFTRMIKGGIEAGPNAVLAFRREGYRRTQLHLGELWETLAYPGFRRIAGRYWREGLDEQVRSFSKSAFVKALQHLLPAIREEDLEVGGAGVRAQAVDRAGNLVDDFLIFEDKQVINVCNAPSPAATASLAIGETIAEKARKRM